MKWDKAEPGTDKTVTTFKGHNIEELPRQELIKALRWAAKAIQELHQQLIKTRSGQHEKTKTCL